MRLDWNIDRTRSLLAHNLLRHDDRYHPSERIAGSLGARIGLAGLAETCHYLLAAYVGCLVENVVADAELAQITQQDGGAQ